MVIIDNIAKIWYEGQNPNTFKAKPLILKRVKAFKGQNKTDA